MTTDRDVFLKAIDVLEVRGWRQGSLRGKDGSVCVMGALLATDATVLDVLGAFVGLSSAVGCDSLSAWNDAPERTVEDVVLALKHAAHGERVAS